MLDLPQIAVVELEAPRKFLPEFDLFSIEELGVDEFFSFARFHLHIDLVLALLDKPIVVLEVSVDFTGELARKCVESSA